jgi:ribosomal protein S18 acetylase RimI-like enzyme
MLEIRPANEADVAAISAMQKASLPETYGAFLGREAVDEFVAGGNVESYFEEHWPHATVATLGGEIVGVAVRLGSLLDLVWVKPAVRSRGIGSALIEAVEEQAAVDGDELTLEVWTANRRALALYERLGFANSRTFEDLATGLEKLELRKTLRQAHSSAEYSRDPIG